jgi:L-Ala-D/L-Glu epimerase
MLIRGIRLFHARINLVNPYRLSFTTLKNIDSIVVEIELENGAVGIGEAVPLKGYSDETKVSIINDAINIINRVNLIDVLSLKELLVEKLPNSHFVISAFFVAIENAMGKILIPSKISIPLVCSISSGANYKDLVEKSYEYYDNGFRTIKVKVGRNISEDCSLARRLLSELPLDYKIRFDANQGYSYQQAVKFGKTICGNNMNLVELFEQPFSVNQWDDHRKFIQNFPKIPVMIDESIITRDDITKAADIGATYVKLKLFKHKGILDLLKLAKYARKLEMKVVLGNGVATSIGNLHEAIAYNVFGDFEGASEGNGFTRLTTETIQNSPKLNSGRLEWVSNSKINASQFDKKLYSLIFKS